jgi:hypothetical protein
MTGPPNSTLHTAHLRARPGLRTASKILEAYFDFLRLKSSRDTGFEDNNDRDAAAITRLKELPLLFHINFHFDVRQPAQSKTGRTSFSTDPWRTIRSKRGTTKVSCQKIFVEWFIMLTWSDIKHIPRVTSSSRPRGKFCEYTSVTVFEEEGHCVVCLEMRADELMRHLISGELTNYRVVRTSPEPL